MVNETIQIDGKGEKERILPLHAHFIPLLVSYKTFLRAYQIYQLEPVFLNKYRKALDPLLKKAGLSPTRFTLHTHVEFEQKKK
ncbi:hypothetical protein LSPCS325_12930 [Lysinibacillus sp. CTST325]